VIQDFVEEILGLHAGHVYHFSGGHARYVLRASVLILLGGASEGACKRNAQKRCQPCCDALHGTGILSSGVRLGKRFGLISDESEYEREGF
jgi:hypothetical protein